MDVDINSNGARSLAQLLKVDRVRCLFIKHRRAREVFEICGLVAIA